MKTRTTDSGWTCHEFQTPTGTWTLAARKGDCVRRIEKLSEEDADTIDPADRWLARPAPRMNDFSDILK